MVHTSSQSLPGVIPATPPRLPGYSSDESSLDELADERIPDTSPFITQPTQVVSNPPTTLKKAIPAALDYDSFSSSPPAPPSGPPPSLNARTSNSSAFPPRIQQSISRFFTRPLPVARMASVSPARRVASLDTQPRSTVPQKRNSDIIELSDDDEDDMTDNRADIQPTTFSRKPKSSYDSQLSQSTSAKPLDIESFWYNGTSSLDSKKVTQKKAVPKTTKNGRKPPRVVLDSDDAEMDKPDPPPRRRRLVRGLPSGEAPSPEPSPAPSSHVFSRVPSHVSTKETTPEEPIAVLSDSEGAEGLTSEDEGPPDTEEEAKLLNLMNDLGLGDLAALTGASESDLKLLIKKRPFKSIAAVQSVCKITEARGKKKRQKVEIGETILDKTRQFMKSITMVDNVVAETELRAKFIRSQLDSWDIDACGLRKTKDKKTGERTGTAVTGFVHTAPSYMNPEMPMHDFQIFGTNWMSLLFKNGYGGILADDMGLGKTCQVIGLMAQMADDYESGQLGDEYPFPNLIVVPPSTLDNWMSEFEKFAPDLTVVKYSGSRMVRDEIAEEIAEDPGQYHAIITSYTQFSQKEDVRNLNSVGLNAAIFDEGQLLKNPLTLQYRRLHQLRTRWRLLLSGTPIQNHLMEMIALLNFVDPELFKDSMDEIQYVFDHKIHTRNLANTALLYGERVNRARSILEPFILQRRKDQVGQNLPPKTHSIVYCDLPKGQKTWYNKYEAMFRADPSARTKDFAGSRTNDMNNVWIQLKKAALHPQLFRRHFTDDVVEEMAQILFKSVPHRELDMAEPKFHLLLEDLKSRSDFDLHLYCQDFLPLLGKFDVARGSWKESGKIAKLLEMIDGYRANGDRVLIFSKFTKVIDIIAYVLRGEGVDYCMLTGGSAVGERQQEIDRFQADAEIPVFLLTTGAGGTGINLTAANKVVIFDMSSNPQDDRQAENRAHRLGQTRPVEVIHLIARETVEELIYRTCQKKIELAEKVTSAASSGADAESDVRDTVREMLVERKEGVKEEERVKEEEGGK